MHSCIPVSCALTWLLLPWEEHTQERTVCDSWEGVLLPAPEPQLGTSCREPHILSPPETLRLQSQSQALGRDLHQVWMGELSQVQLLSSGKDLDPKFCEQA